MTKTGQRVTIIGAGIGGLAAALRLSHAGYRVTVLERHAAPGGKMRRLLTAAGPVDAGPTVLTMRDVFVQLFADVGADIADHVTLTPEDTLARHFWSDGTVLDLTSDTDRNIAGVTAAFGPRAAKDFARFTARAAKLYDAFEGPVMQAPEPSQSALRKTVLKDLSLLPAMAPHRTLASALNGHFRDRRLAQLFARYATYVGGIPDRSPAILSLIWEAERRGVWHVTGGMHALATAIEALAKSKGARFVYNADVTRIEAQDGRVANVRTRDARFDTDAVLFNGDPRALCTGLLGPIAADAVPADAAQPRSLSAYVASFAAIPNGPELAAHNVFFADDPTSEYDALSAGQIQPDPTLYICAQDRFGNHTPTGLERFEIIMNAAPVHDGTPVDEKEKQQCQTQISASLKRHGLTFTPDIQATQITPPAMFADLFPASNGSLYGRSPQGLMAAFKRPTARTATQGLYLVGGGAHPGAGVPMAALSARHAVAAITQDLSSTSTFPQAAMHGGTSTGSPTAAPAPSRSSDS